MSPSRAWAQAPVPSVVAVLPATGEARPTLLQDVDDAVRAAITARGDRVPDLVAIRAAMAGRDLASADGRVQVARMLGAGSVLTTAVQPFLGQTALTLVLEDAQTGRSARESINAGRDEITVAIASAVARLFAPERWGPTAEERAAENARAEAQARAEAELQRAREEAARRDRDAEQLRQRAEAERQRQARLAEERATRRFAEGGAIAVEAAGTIGGRITPVAARPAGVPAAEVLYGGFRIGATYAVLPAVGLEVGGTVAAAFSPTSAVAFGPSVRLAFPATVRLPVRGSAGVSLGLFQGVSGARSSLFWLTGDVRAEWLATRNVTVFAGLGLEGAIPAFGALWGQAGVRVSFGDVPAVSRPRAQ